MCRKNEKKCLKYLKNQEKHRYLHHQTGTVSNWFTILFEAAFIA